MRENIRTPKKTDSNSSVSSNSVISCIRQCEKGNVQFQGQKENKTQHENLQDLANELNDLAITSTELESHKERRDPSK